MNSREEKEKKDNFNKRLNDEEETLTVGDILEAMSEPKYPSYIKDLLYVIQEWMYSALSGDMDYQAEDFFQGYAERNIGDPEVLFANLEWLEKFADILPAPHMPKGKSDAVVLCVGTIDLEEGMRMAVDYASLFGRGKCRKVWVVSESWSIPDTARYIHHIRVLRSQGVDFRFLLVTPWGWTEIPLFDDAFSYGRLYWENAMGSEDAIRRSSQRNKKKDSNA